MLQRALLYLFSLSTTTLSLAVATPAVAACPDNPSSHVRLVCGERGDFDPRMDLNNNLRSFVDDLRNATYLHH